MAVVRTTRAANQLWSANVMTERAIIHVDMDAFYASVEQRDNPALRGKPVIVGGHPSRGVVLAASYEVRPFGVRSAMPMAWAIRQAPKAIVVPPRFEAYAAASDAVFSIFEKVTPLIEPLSLDEAFLDVTASIRLMGKPWDIATRIRQRIKQETDLPCSAGIAPVKFVAKIVSDLAKPNGQKEVKSEDVIPFLSVLPVSRLWGVGPKTEEFLASLNLRTIGDVGARSRQWLADKLGSSGQHFWELSHGIDTRVVVPDRDAKSIGAEDTFEMDLGEEEILPHIHGQAMRVARRLRRAAVRTRVVQLKLKYSDFKLATRRLTLEHATDDGQELYRAALELMSRAPLPKKVRLTGISAQDLGGSDQLALFDGKTRRSGRLNQALDAIANKYGSDAVKTADLVETELDGYSDELRARAGASHLDKHGKE